MLFGLNLYPEFGGDIFLRNSVEFQRTTRRYNSEHITLQKFLTLRHESNPWTASGGQSTASVLLKPAHHWLKNRIVNNTNITCVHKETKISSEVLTPGMKLQNA
jgi:hypothetical protein